MKTSQEQKVYPRPSNVTLLRASWSLLDGIWGFLKGSLGGAGTRMGLPAILD